MDANTIQIEANQCTALHITASHGKRKEFAANRRKASRQALSVRSACLVRSVAARQRGPMQHNQSSEHQFNTRQVNTFLGDLCEPRGRKVTQPRATHSEWQQRLANTFKATQRRASQVKSQYGN